MEKEEQLLRTVKEFGNGAHIFVPKEWAGEQVMLVKQPRKSVNDRIIDVLEPYFDSIIGAYLYGSYARGEQREDSDIDLFIITNRKIKIKKEGFEIICIEEEDIEKAFKIEPLMMHSIISESKVIINSKILDELRKKYKPILKEFKGYINSTKRLIDVNNKFLNSGEEYYDGDAVPYSLVLRLRGIFIMFSLLKGKKYSYKLFSEWISENLPEINFKLIYESYRNSKNDKKIKHKIRTKDLSLLIEFLRKEINLLEHGKA